MMEYFTIWIYASAVFFFGFLYGWRGGWNDGWCEGWNIDGCKISIATN